MDHEREFIRSVSILRVAAETVVLSLIAAAALAGLFHLLDLN